MKFPFSSVFRTVCNFLGVVVLCLALGVLLSAPVFFFSERFPRAFFVFSAFVFLCFFAAVIFQHLIKRFSYAGLSREEKSREKRLFLVRFLKTLFIILSASGSIFLVLRGMRLPALAVLVMPFIIFRIFDSLRRKKPVKSPESGLQ